MQEIIQSTDACKFHACDKNVLHFSRIRDKVGECQSAGAFSTIEQMTEVREKIVFNRRVRESSRRLIYHVSPVLTTNDAGSPFEPEPIMSIDAL